MTTLDLKARYRVDGWPGVAFYLIGYREVITEDGDPDYDTDWVRAVMVGDDREHLVEVADLIPLDEGDYCHSCGQIGCGHNVPS